jgi:HlyD family secretion protein
MTSTPDLSSLRIQRDDDSGDRSGRGPAVVIAVIALALAAAGGWYFVTRGGGAIEVRAAVANASGGGSASSAGISANGYVVARTRASVSAKVLGRLATLRVHEGSFLRLGEIIATIEDADFRAQVAAARAAEQQIVVQVTQAKRDLKRAEQLRQSQLNAEIDLEGAQTRLETLSAQLESAKAQTQIAEASLENTRVRAPFDGTVLRKDAEVGEIVAPSSAGGGLTRTAIVTMADLATLEVEVDVNEAYIAQIRSGQGARITLDAYPDTSFRGRVRQVVPTADRQKATVQVKVSILDHDPRILPEMGAKVLFEKEAGSAIHVAARRVSVPQAAVVGDASGARVWVIENGRVNSRRVETGPARDDEVEIRSGLAGGESVVVQPPAGLRNGTRVRVRGAASGAQGE